MNHIIGAEEQLELLGIQKYLTSEGISISVNYDSDLDQYYIDLDTGAKSHLWLYQDRTLRGRYGYEVVIEERDLEGFTDRLCREFVNALCGRDYYNMNWRVFVKNVVLK